MISFVPTMPTKGSQMPAAGAEQSGAGIFQGILLEAMLGARGAQAAGQLAAQFGALAQSGEVPGQLAGGPVAQGDAQSMALPPTQTQTGVQTQTTSIAPDAAMAGLPIRLTGPVPPTTVTVDSSPLPQGLPTEDEVDDHAPMAATSTDAALMSQVQAAQVLAPVTPLQTQPQPLTPPTTPQAPATGQQALPAVQGANQTGAELEAFVQQAVQVAQGEPPVSTEAPEQATGDAVPTFQDLVKLVMDADKARPTGQTAQSGGEGEQTQSQQYPAGALAPTADETAPEPGTVTAGPDPAPMTRPSVTAASEAPQEAPRQPVEPEQVLRQVTRFIKVMVDAKQSEVRLNLHPEHLGHIAVKLVVGEGVIRANLVAQDMAVKVALEANLDQLKTRLSDQGFQVEQVHVTVGSNSGQPQHSRQGEQRQPQQQSNWRPTHEETRNQQDPALQSRPAPSPWSVRGTGVRLNSLA